MKYLFYSTICLILFYRPVMAEDIHDVENLLKEKIGVVISVLNNNELDMQNRNEKIIGVVNSVFDLQLMAKLSLGKKYWPGLSKEEKEEFTDLFIKRLQDSYVEKLDLYADETVIYRTPKTVNKRIHMSIDLISNDDKISMLYKLYNSKKGWKIYDIEIQGVSIIQTFRSQFDGVLKTGTIIDLLEKLKVHGQFPINTPEK